MAEAIDRLSIRARPGGFPVMRQHWGKLLFMHWPVDAALLRPLVPARLAIDTFDGQAWVGVVPFTMWGIRPTFAPPAPGLSRMHELNVRTYVHLDGVPGVWFLSLDVQSVVATWAARTLYFLPYYTAEMSLRQQGRTIHYESRRTTRGAPRADFEAAWEIGELLNASRPGSLTFFLTERYCLYSARGDKRLYRARINHPAWPLNAAELRSHRSTMIESHGLPTPHGTPLLHYAEHVKVDIWMLERV